MQQEDTREAGARLERVDAKQMRIAVGCTTAPPQQMEPWEHFEATEGHQLFGRYVYYVDGKPRAAIALYRYALAHQHFLWARSGPIWLGEHDPDQEDRFRRMMIAEVRRRDSSILFVRMHLRFETPALERPVGVISYDHTVVINLRPRDPEAIAAAMPRDGRRGVKRAKRVAEEAGTTIAEETGMTRQAFRQVYRVLVETAQRDGFRPHDEAYYWNMLECLGPELARMFVLRDAEGTPHCWTLVLQSRRYAWAAFGASSQESRKWRGAEALDWAVACILAAEGVEDFDLAGAESSRAPQLYSVGRYKRRFACHSTEVDPAWDVPVKPTAYALLVRAREARHWLRRHGI